MTALRERVLQLRSHLNTRISDGLLEASADDLIESTLRALVEECAQVADRCASERKTQREYILSESNTPDVLHRAGWVSCKMSEAQRIAQAIREKGGRG